jgi:hypothetical protein
LIHGSLPSEELKTHTNYKGEFNGKRSSFEKDGGSD